MKVFIIYCVNMHEHIPFFIKRNEDVASGKDHKDNTNNTQEDMVKTKVIF